MDPAHQKRMDKTYGRMKYVYDITRPLFLAGRGMLRRSVQPCPGQRVLEVGCGTGRNLILLARDWPSATFTGLDISSEMLSYARMRVERSGVAARISLFEGELGDFVSTDGCGDHFDYILFSYSLSMIPDWQAVLRRSLPLLKPGTGKLLIADFGACEKWPGPLARRLYKNLSYFHVTPRPELGAFLKNDLANGGLQVRQHRLLGGYGQVLEVTRPSSQCTVSA